MCKFEKCTTYSSLLPASSSSLVTCPLLAGEGGGHDIPLFLPTVMPKGIFSAHLSPLPTHFSLIPTKNNRG